MRQRARSSAIASDSCGSARAAAARARAARSTNHRRATQLSPTCVLARKRRPARVPARRDACRHSAGDDAESGWNRTRRSIVSAQSCHFARWTATSGRKATQGTRIASATMAPCIASLSNSRQVRIAAMIASGSSRRSIRVMPAATAASAQAPRPRLSKCGMNPIARPPSADGTGSRIAGSPRPHVVGRHRTRAVRGPRTQ
jgi:hypothetical protein